MVGTAIVGIPVPKSPSAGGTRDPTSESSQATKLLSDKFDQGDMAMIVTVTSNDGVEARGPRGGHRHRPTLQTTAHRQVMSARTTPLHPR
jgi:RND superfamily putative drug exporter